jgi:hypothetical protein
MSVPRTGQGPGPAAAPAVTLFGVSKQPPPPPSPRLLPNSCRCGVVRTATGACPATRSGMFLTSRSNRVTSVCPIAIAPNLRDHVQSRQIHQAAETSRRLHPPLSLLQRNSPSPGFAQGCDWQGTAPHGSWRFRTRATWEDEASGHIRRRHGFGKQSPHARSVPQTSTAETRQTDIGPSGGKGWSAGSGDPPACNWSNGHIVKTAGNEPAPPNTGKKSITSLAKPIGSP